MAAWSQFSDNGAPKGYGQPGVLTQRAGRGVTPQRAALSSALTREDDPDGLPPPVSRPKPVAPKQPVGGGGSGAAPWDAASASINAPRIVQRGGQTYLTEHGNWRLLQPGEIESATKYRDDFWAANPTGFQAGVGVQKNEDYANYGQEVIPGESPVTARGGSHAKPSGASSSDTPAAQAQRYALNQALSPTEIMGGFSRRGGGGGGGGSFMEGVGGGAGVGATVGSMIPVIGTGLGGMVGGLVGGVGSMLNRRASSAPSDFSVADARSAIQQAYRNYLGREASEAEIQSQLQAQGLKQGDSWVGEQGLGAVLSSIQGSEEAKKAAAVNAALEAGGADGGAGGSGGGAGGESGTSADAPPPAAGPYAGNSSAAGVGFEGFDFTREQDRSFSAKDSFAHWASQAPEPPPGLDKAALTDWFITHVQPGMEADGMVINWVEGDKFNFTSPQGTFTVDWVRGAGADGFGLSWQVEGPGGGGSGTSAGASMQQAALSGALNEQAALDPGEAFGSSSNYLQYFLDILRKNKVLDPNEPGVMTSRQRY